MVTEILTVFMLSATATTAQHSACKPGRQLTACEAQIFGDAVLWKRRAHTTRARLEGCEEKLAIRTASVGVTLAPCEVCPEQAPSIATMITTGTAAAIIGLIAGFLVAM